MAKIIHTPVLLQAVLNRLAPSDDKVYVDCTLGEGGHSEAILKAAPACRVCGIEQDPAIAARAAERLAPFGERFRLFRSNFSRLQEVLTEGGFPRVDGILMDLGISSFHYEASGRGFSFQRDEPLDMRLDPDRPESAADLVNGYSESELCRILWDFGEEKMARRIVARIAARRMERPFETAADLAETVAAAVPGHGRGMKIHPATRTFQALRIAVNRELEVLEEALVQAADMLLPGGRLCVISFHSLEDRIVKRFIRSRVPHCICPERAPVCTCGEPGDLRIVNKKPDTALPEELAGNPRSRSAKLRVAEKVDRGQR